MGEFAVVRRREASGHGGMYVLPPTTHSHCDGQALRLQVRAPVHERAHGAQRVGH